MSNERDLSMDNDLRFEMEIGPVMHPTKRGKPEKPMPLLKAYELVIENMAGKCDYEKDAEIVAALDVLEGIYTELREPK